MYFCQVGLVTDWPERYNFQAADCPPSSGSRQRPRFALSHFGPGHFSRPALRAFLLTPLHSPDSSPLPPADIGSGHAIQECWLIYKAILLRMSVLIMFYDFLLPNPV